MTLISRSLSCSCMRESARSITCLREIGSRLTGAARPNVRRCEMISVALWTCCVVRRNSRTIWPLSVAPSSMRSIAFVVGQDVKHGLPLVGEALVELVQVAHDMEQRAALLVACTQAAFQRLH